MIVPGSASEQEPKTAESAEPIKASSFPRGSDGNQTFLDVSVVATFQLLALRYQHIIIVIPVRGEMFPVTAHSTLSAPTQPARIRLRRSKGRIVNEF